MVQLFRLSSRDNATRACNHFRCIRGMLHKNAPLPIPLLIDLWSNGARIGAASAVLRNTHAQKLDLRSTISQWTASEKAPSNLLFPPLIAIVKG